MASILSRPQWVNVCGRYAMWNFKGFLFFKCPRGQMNSVTKQYMVICIMYELLWVMPGHSSKTVWCTKEISFMQSIFTHCYMQITKKYARLLNSMRDVMIRTYMSSCQPVRTAVDITIIRFLYSTDSYKHLHRHACLKWVVNMGVTWKLQLWV